jgi:drug/metabolite transporter (DMT)-like permease
LTDAQHASRRAVPAAPGSSYVLGPGLRYMVGAAFFFSLMSLFVKLTGAHLPTMEIVFFRSLITLALSGAMLWRYRIGPWGSARKLLFLRGVLGFAALSCFYYGVVHLPLAEATVVHYTNPVFTAVLAALLLSERIGPKEVGLTLLSLSGVVIMTRPAFLFGGGESALPPLAIGVALAGAVFSGAAYTTVRKLSETDHPVVIVTWFSAVSVLGSLPFMIVPHFLASGSAPSLGDGWNATLFPMPSLPSGGVWLLLLGVGVTTQLGQLFLTYGLKAERAGRAMSVAYLQIVFAALWGVLLFSDLPDVATVMGAAVIIGATAALGRVRPLEGMEPRPGRSGAFPPKS